MSTVRVGRLGLEFPDAYKLYSLVMVTPSDSGGLRNVTVAQQPVMPGSTLDEFKKDYAAQMSRANAGFSVVKASTISLAGKSCPLLEANNVGPGGEPMANLLAFFPVGSTVLILCATERRGAPLENARKELVGIFESLQLTP
jgi:hypothetical protein